MKGAVNRLGFIMLQSHWHSVTEVHTASTTRTWCKSEARRSGVDTTALAPPQSWQSEAAVNVPVVHTGV